MSRVSPERLTELAELADACEKNAAIQRTVARLNLQPAVVADLVADLRDAREALRTIAEGDVQRVSTGQSVDAWLDRKPTKVVYARELSAREIARAALSSAAQETRA